MLSKMFQMYSVFFNTILLSSFSKSLKRPDIVEYLSKNSFL